MGEMSDVSESVFHAQLRTRLLTYFEHGPLCVLEDSTHCLARFSEGKIVAQFAQRCGDRTTQNLWEPSSTLPEFVLDFRHVGLFRNYAYWVEN